MKKNMRISNIELLKILAILMIILSHSVPLYGNNESYVNLNLATGNNDNLIMIFFKYLGQIGNAIFIICSSYFLLDSKNIKLKKIVNMVLDCTVISLVYYFIFKFFNYEMNREIILTHIFPTIYPLNYWFIACYILFYMAHPLLNKIINSVEKRELLKINIILLILYCILNMLMDINFYYNELIGFFIIYFFVSYMKKYMNNFTKSTSANFMIFLWMTFLLSIYIMMLNVLGLCSAYYSDKMLYWCKIFNPFVLGISFSLFNIFSNINLKNSKTINYLSSLSLLVYTFSDNYLLRNIVRADFFLRYFGNDVIKLVLIEFVRLIVWGYFLAIFYNIFVQRLVSYVRRKNNRLY